MLGLDVIFFSISMSFNIRKKKTKNKKIGGEDAEFYFLFW